MTTLQNEKGGVYHLRNTNWSYKFQTRGTSNGITIWNKRVLLDRRDVGSIGTGKSLQKLFISIDQLSGHSVQSSNYPLLITQILQFIIKNVNNNNILKRAFPKEVAICDVG